MIVEYTIYGKMPSLNEVIEETRKLKYAGARMKKKVQNDIEIQLLNQIREDGLLDYYPFKKQVDIDITYHEKTRKRDKDNISSSKKFLFDAMVQVGILKNDGWKWIGDISEKFVLDNKYKVVIKLTERKGEE